MKSLNYIIIVLILQFSLYNQDDIMNSVSYQEDENYCTYLINTPILPNYITQDDIQIFIQNDQMQVRALGSGMRLNKDIKKNVNFLRKVPVWKSRDWELWLNLKDKLKNSIQPSIKKSKKEDGSFQVLVSFRKGDIDFVNSHLKEVIPLLKSNQSTEILYNNPFKTKIPINPLYKTHILASGKEFITVENNMKTNSTLFERDLNKEENQKVYDRFTPIQKVTSIVNLNELGYYQPDPNKFERLKNNTHGEFLDKILNFTFNKKLYTPFDHEEREAYDINKGLDINNNQSKLDLIY